MHSEPARTSCARLAHSSSSPSLAALLSHAMARYMNAIDTSRSGALSPGLDGMQSPVTPSTFAPPPGPHSRHNPHQNHQQHYAFQQQQMQQVQQPQYYAHPPPPAQRQSAQGGDAANPWSSAASNPFPQQLQQLVPASATPMQQPSHMQHQNMHVQFQQHGGGGGGGLARMPLAFDAASSSFTIPSGGGGGDADSPLLSSGKGDFAGMKAAGSRMLSSLFSAFSSGGGGSGRDVGHGKSTILLFNTFLLNRQRVIRNCAIAAALLLALVLVVLVWRSRGPSGELAPRTPRGGGASAPVVNAPAAGASLEIQQAQARFKSPSALELDSASTDRGSSSNSRSSPPSPAAATPPPPRTATPSSPKEVPLPSVSSLDAGLEEIRRLKKNLKDMKEKVKLDKRAAGEIATEKAKNAFKGVSAQYQKLLQERRGGGGANQDMEDSEEFEHDEHEEEEQEQEGEEAADFDDARTQQQQDAASAKGERCSSCSSRERGAHQGRGAGGLQSRLGRSRSQERSAGTTAVQEGTRVRRESQNGDQRRRRRRATAAAAAKETQTAPPPPPPPADSACRCSRCPRSGVSMGRHRLERVRPREQGSISLRHLPAHRRRETSGQSDVHQRAGGETTDGHSGVHSCRLHLFLDLSDSCSRRG